MKNKAKRYQIIDNKTGAIVYSSEYFACVEKKYMSDELYLTAHIRMWGIRL